MGLGLRGNEMEKRWSHFDRALWTTGFEIMHQLSSWRQAFTPWATELLSNYQVLILVGVHCLEEASPNSSGWHPRLTHIGIALTHWLVMVCSLECVHERDSCTHSRDVYMRVPFCSPRT